MHRVVCLLFTLLIMGCADPQVSAAGGSSSGRVDVSTGIGF